MKFKITFLGLIVLCLLWTTSAKAQIYQGTIRVGETQTFTTIQSALDAIGTPFTGHIYVEIDPGTYDEQISLNYSDNTGLLLFIRKTPGSSGDVIISPSIQTATSVFHIEDGMNVRIENLKFIDSGAANGGIAAEVYNCSYTAFVGCTFESRRTYTNPYMAVALNYLSNNGEGNYLSKCNFVGGAYGIYAQGSSLSVDSSFITDFSEAGILSESGSGVFARQNYFKDKPTSGTDTIYAFQSKWTSGTIEFLENKIELSSDRNKIGILADFSEYGYTCNLHNNMVSIYGNTGAKMSQGIALGTGQYQNLIYNSILISDGNLYSAPLYISSGSTSIVSSNNIFASQGMGVAFRSESATPFESSNYNIYQTGQGETVAYWYDGFQHTLASLQTLGYESNSYRSDVQFMSISDLHLAANYNIAESKGINQSIIYDIDGDYRNGRPDIGADECDRQFVWSGNVSGYVSWSDTVYVNSDVTILPSSTLEIYSPATIIFQGPFELNNRGTLSINTYGEGDAYVTLTAADKIEGWHGIIDTSFSATTNAYKSIFEYAKNANKNGGAIYCTNSNSSFTKNIFRYNEAENGAAICIEGSSRPTIEQNLFHENVSSNSGGAVYSYQSMPKIINNIFKNNTAVTGGGMTLVGGSPTFAFNTFYENSATDGTQLYLDNFYGNIYNTIFNTTDESRVISGNNSYPMIFKSVVSGGASGINAISYEDFGVLDIDPMFKNPSENNFRLHYTSLAVDSAFDISLHDISVYSDFFGRNRPADAGYDIGACENQLFANAGEDVTACYAQTSLMPNMVQYELKGFWTIAEGGGTFVNMSYGSTSVSAIPSGINRYVWNVTDGTDTVSDTTIYTNTLPIADAGSDVFTHPLNYGDPFPDVTLSANDPTPNSGIWTIFSSDAPAISTETDPQAVLSSINYGIHTLAWTVTNATDSECTNSDTVVVVAGYSFVSEPSDDTLYWDNPDDWNLGYVPGEADSVTIYGCAAVVEGGVFNADKIVVGNGGKLILRSSGFRLGASLNAHSLYIAQDAERFGNTRGAAEAVIEGNGTINIGPDINARGSKAVQNPGVFIGNGGSLYIQQTAERIDFDATLRITRGANLFVEGTESMPATINMADGGKLLVGTSGFLRGGASNVYVRNGGSIYISQTAEKRGATEMRVGGNLYIQQTAERGSAKANVTVRGGNIYVEQTAERGYSNGVNVGNGGSLYIQQTAERVPSEISAPNFYTNGGQIIIGTPGVRGNASARFGSIYIQQTAERANAVDTALIVNMGGILQFTNNFWTDDKFQIAKGQAVQIYEGGMINLNGEWWSAMMNMEEGASLIDMNSASSLSGSIQKLMVHNQVTPIAVPFGDMNNWTFDGDLKLYEWNEYVQDFEPTFIDGSYLETAAGYFVNNIGETNNYYFYGTFNTGSFEKFLTADNAGWNFAGNPYPSAIDWESMNLSEEITPASYVFDPRTQNFNVYMKGGISTNGADRFILPQTPFFVKTQNEARLNFENANRVHYFGNAMRAENPSNTMTITATFNGVTDQTVIAVNNSATENYDTQYDAPKFASPNEMLPSIMSVLTDEDQVLAINQMPEPGLETVIPVGVMTRNSGTYTLDFTNAATFSYYEPYVVDLSNMMQYSITDAPMFSFTHDAADGDFRSFALRFRNGSSVETQLAEVHVFAAGKAVTVSNNSSEIVNVKIYDISGKLLKTGNVSANSNSEISANLAAGIYLVNVNNGTTSKTQKVMIQ